MTLLDVGSYTGDSILQIQEIFKGKISRIYGFEPSQDNYEKLKELNIYGLSLYKVGLGNQNGKEYFSESGPFFRASNEKKGVLTEIARLDDLKIAVEGKCILKIDIEGSEMQCLEGGEQFIKQHKPYIAVCVYHKERDVLHIPQYLKKILPEYHFILRGGMHTVCYAFPE